MSEFLYEVGDEFEGSPVLGSRFLAEVQAVGGLVEIDGSIIRIIYLPASVHGEVQVADKYKDEVPAAKEEAVEVAVEATETVKIAVAEAVETINEAVDTAVDAVHQAEDVVAPEPKTPAKRGRKPAATKETINEE